MLPMRAIILAVCLPAVLIGGCTAEYATENQFPAARITVRDSWKITGDLTGLGNAIDGDPATAAVSAASYTNAEITLDLGKVCMFNTVIVQHGSDENGFARRVSILTSVDGQEYTLRGASPGNRLVSYFVLVTPVVGRYVRLHVTVPGARPWSVAEIYLQ